MASFSASIDPSSLNFSFPTSGDYSITSTIAVSKGLGDRIAERTGSGVPKFKSCTPPSLPISPSFVSSSSSQFSRFSIPPGLSPSELLDSPVLLYGSNILPSPTTGSFSADAINWRDYSNTIEQDVKLEEDKYPSDFTFEHQANVSQSQTSTIPTFEQLNHLGSVKESNEQDDPLTEKATEKSDYDYVQPFSPEIANIQEYTEPNKEFQSSTNQYTQSSSEQKRSEDGYNWRKYGQKQVKGSENPRSYYKCTYPNCISKKKVERCLDGQIAQIVYRGNHSHPKPDSTRRSSNYSLYNVQANDSMDHSSTSNGNGQLDSSITQDNSSISVGDCDFEQSFEKGKPVGDEFDDEEPEAKRWKRECENEGVSAPGSRAVREPRIVVQTTSEIDILDDGYRWRKYGQKVVRGNPNPRSYYKCTFIGCTVRKHVERASHDLKLVITTYEGRHNHDIPAARGAGNVRGYLDYSSIH